jgi:sec-independent protein translocase protein TatC
MATTVIKPIGHEERLSLVEHLDELRTRLIVCVVAFLVCFAFTYAENGRVLDLINKPLEATQNLDGKKASGDPLEQSARFQLRIGDALRSLGPAMTGLQRSQEALAKDRAVDPATRRLVQQQTQVVLGAAAKIQTAAAATPTNVKRQPVTLGVAEPFVTTMSVAGYAALLLSLPLILYQLYAFVLPAFSPAERRTALPLMAMVPFLFLGGVVFGYLVALPRAVDFLQNFNDSNFDILIQAKDFYRFSILFLVLMGVLFQIPVGILAITRLGIVSVAQLRKQRGIVILILAVVAAVATPTPDPVTMLLAMGPLVVLFEFSLLLARFFERRMPRRSSRWEWDDDEDEDAVEWPHGHGDDYPSR